ncbi:hypothetical protein Daesc_007801 [Daldinia eschscholtzii]|uniref:Uncharacterized protein n=1 Tax=Daldinia eschscholtzii TaxID=292717 RepID=A0AAX6MF40_9PEZI
MFARLRSDIFPTPAKTNSPSPPKSLKHRLFLDEDGDEYEDEDEDEDARPPSPKKRKRRKKTHYSVAPLFDKYRRSRADEDNQATSHIPSRHQHLSPSPDPDLDPPLVSELGERYANLRATVHSAAIAGLEEAEAEIIAQSEAKIHANRQKLATLEAQLNKLISPLQNLTVDYTATGEDGRERTAAVAIRDAIFSFRAKLKAAVEIDDLGEETLSRKGSEGATDEARPTGVSTVSGISPSTSASHAEVLAGFGMGLDRASKDVVEEMIRYEEIVDRSNVLIEFQECLKNIEKEAGNILHSFLNS